MLGGKMFALVFAPRYIHVRPIAVFVREAESAQRLGTPNAGHLLHQLRVLRGTLGGFGLLLGAPRERLVVAS